MSTASDHARHKTVSTCDWDPGAWQVGGETLSPCWPSVLIPRILSALGFPSPWVSAVPALLPIFLPDILSWIGPEYQLQAKCCVCVCECVCACVYVCLNTVPAATPASSSAGVSEALAPCPYPCPRFPLLVWVWGSPANHSEVKPLTQDMNKADTEQIVRLLGQCDAEIFQEEGQVMPTYQVTETHPLDTANKDANPNPTSASALSGHGSLFLKPWEPLHPTPNPLSFPWPLMPTCCLQWLYNESTLTTTEQVAEKVQKVLKGPALHLLPA